MPDLGVSPFSATYMDERLVAEESMMKGNEEEEDQIYDNKVKSLYTTTEYQSELDTSRIKSLVKHQDNNNITIKNEGDLTKTVKFIKDDISDNEPTSILQ
jgi:hypothetical protein